MPCQRQAFSDKSPEKARLENRIYVENSIGIIKKNERVMTRKDHKINNYMSFVYIASLINNLKVLSKL